jgi:ubiquinone/menaquinone biosynthesis C-methylase UbiE
MSRFFKNSLEKREQKYLSQFSPFKYKIFLFIEKLYKALINNEDKRIVIIKKYIKKIKPKKILEIGSGVFPMYEIIIPLIKSNKYEYHICEINPKKVDYIKRKIKNKQINIICGNAFSLPYPENYFDLVISKGVLHHIFNANLEKTMEKKILFLEESKRVLKENGKNLLMDYYNQKRIKDLFWHFLYKIILGEGDYYYLNKEELKKIFEISGYKIIEIAESDTFKGQYYCIIGEK